MTTFLENARALRALQVARRLIDCGVPVFAAPPAIGTDGTWDPAGGHNGCGYWLPPAWEKTVPTEHWLDPNGPIGDRAHRPGWALCAVMGHKLDLLDVDPRNGGDTTRQGLVAAGMWPTVYAVAETPSGGTHEFVAPLGAGSRDGVRDGLDVKGGLPDGTGRGFAFIAPTVKLSKVTGEIASYRWTVEPADLDTAGDDSGAAVAELVRQAKARNNGQVDGDAFAGVDGKTWPHTGPIPDGKRHPALVSYAGSLRRRDVHLDEALVLFRLRWQDCEQPPAARYPCTWDEAQEKLRDVYTRYVPGEGPEPAEAEDDTATPTTVVTLADVTPEHVRWLWPAHLPRGKLVILDGDPSTGKSTLTLDLAGRLSAGTKWPDDTPVDIPGDTLIMSAEDGLADTIAPRLTAAGADLTRVHALLEVPLIDDEGAIRSVPPSLPRDIPVLQQVITGRGIRLVVIDVLMAYLSGKVDSHRDQDVRGVLHQLAAMAERTGATIILIRHLNKSGGGHALYRGGGSIGIIGAARAAFLVARDPEDEQRRILAVTKSNLAAEPPALAYRLVDDPLNFCARVEWEDQPTEHRAADLLRAPVTDDERVDQMAQNYAVEWLRELLAEGPVKATDVYRQADHAGLSKDQAKRAKKKIGAAATHPEIDGPWYWQMPLSREHLGSVGSGTQNPAPYAPLPLPSSEPLFAAEPPKCRTCGLGLRHPASVKRGTCDRHHQEETSRDDPPEGAECPHGKARTTRRASIATTGVAHCRCCGHSFNGAVAQSDTCRTCREETA